MPSPFDELAALVGRVLADRWLREQQPLSTRRDAAETPAGDGTKSASGRNEEELDSAP